MKYRIRSERQFDAMGQEIAYFNDGNSAPIVQTRPGAVDYSLVSLACKAGTWKRESR